MYRRTEYQTIKSRLEEPRKFIQVVTGPRQVGKFRKLFNPRHSIVVGDGGVGAEEFLGMDINALF